MKTLPDIIIHLRDKVIPLVSGETQELVYDAIYALKEINYNQRLEVSRMTEQINYEQKAIYTIPPAMRPWGMTIVEPSLPREYFGEYVLVGIEQATIELHHQVEVIDESGDPLPVAPGLSLAIPAVALKST